MKFCNGLRLLVLATLLFVSTLAFAGNSKEQQLRDFHSLLTELQTHYGMAKYKEKILGVTFGELDKKYSSLIQSATTLEEANGFSPATKRDLLSMEEFQQLMVGFGAEFQDGHLNVKRNGNEGWTLGIKTAEIEGRLYVTGFNPDFYKPTDVVGVVEVGDEVIQLNGLRIEDIARENMLYAQLATYDSRWQWSLERILEVPHGFLRAKNDGEQVQVKFRRVTPQGTHVFTGRFNWANVKKFYELRTGNPRYLKPLEKTPYYFGTTGSTESYFHEGLEALNLPDGEILDLGILVNANIRNELKMRNLAKADTADDISDLKPISRLKVYSVLWGDLRVGVIRIPNYSPDTYQDVLSEIAFLRRSIPLLNAHTDMLVIDQVSNNGGYVNYVTQLVKLFAHDDEIHSVTADIRLTDTYVRTMEGSAQALAAGKQIKQTAEEDPELPNFTDITISRLMADRLEAKLKAGDEWTGPLPYMGTVDSINEGQTGTIVSAGDVTYRKKVMILNDGRSASGGDFMPAIMKDVRALVVGTTSKGLGGPVYSSIDSMTSAQMFIRCPYAYCERVDGTPFENVGVVPDVKRPITPDDLREDFGNFAVDVMNIATLYYHGQKPAEIEARVYQAERNRGEWSPPGRAILLAANDVQVAQANNDLKGVASAYAKLTKKIVQVGAQVPADEWPRINIPIAQALLNQDQILSSVGNRDAVLDRLRQMQKLDPIKKDPKLLKIIGAVVKTLTAVPRNTAVITPCALLLENVAIPTPTLPGPAPNPAPAA